MRIEPGALPARGSLREPAPGDLVWTLRCQLLQDRVHHDRRLGQPPGAFAAMAPHRLECRATDDLDQLVRRAQLTDETARRAHGLFGRVAHLASTEPTALHARDDHFPHGDVNAARRDTRAQKLGELRRHSVLERPHADSTRRASPATSTRTVPPSRSLPATMS